MTSAFTYLDYNATAPLRPEAQAAMVEALQGCGNPSSVHAAGRRARGLVEDARAAVAALVAAEPGGVVFLSGGSEANNLALLGCGRRRMLVSAIEHASVLGAASAAEHIPVTPDGIVDLAALERLLADAGADTVVAVMLANNETGVVQPLAEVVRLAHAAGALVLADAVQAAGKMPIDMPALGVDLLTLSAHKLGGPPGVGALVLAPGLAVTPLVRGGGQERGRRAGTENVPGIVGFGAAARLAAAEAMDGARLAALRDQLERALPQDCIVVGAASPRLANTSCFALPGLSAETQVMALDLEGVMVSAGAACSSGKVGPSHVLAAMGLAETVVRSALRVSFGWASRVEDIDRFLTAWRRHAERARQARADAA